MTADPSTSSTPAPPPALSTSTPGPLPLSVAIVCKNSAATIERTLASVRPLAKQIVALDSGSTDNTLSVLAAFGAQIHHIAWMGHVKTKQAALEACGEPWILCLDSDESVEPALADDLRAVITADGHLWAGAASAASAAGAAGAAGAASAAGAAGAASAAGAGGAGGRGGRGGRVDGWEVNRKVWYAGRFLEHTWQPEWRLRLVRNGAAHWQGIDPHDKLTLRTPGAVGRLRGDLRHDSIGRIDDFLARQVRYGRISADGLWNLGRRGSVLGLLTSPPGAFVKQYLLKRGVLDGWRGLLGATSAAVAAAAKHAALLERSRTGDDPRPQ
jgi:hypothetical protein